MQINDKNNLFSIEKHIGNSILTGKHFHDTYEFYYLVEGAISYFIDNKIYTLEKGDLVFIPPQTIHNTISTSNPLRTRMLFYLDKSFLAPISDADLIPWDTATIFHVADQKRISVIYNELLNEFQGENNQVYLRALLCELLILLQRLNTVYTSEFEEASSKILEIISYVNSEYSQSISLDSVAKHFYINPSYLSRTFKQYTGMKFSEYLNKCRVKNANILLTETNKKVTEIATLCGYNSTNHFCKVYKQVMNISPREYRNHFLSK